MKLRPAELRCNYVGSEIQKDYQQGRVREHGPSDFCRDPGLSHSAVCSVFPSDLQRVELRKAHLLEARASLMALDVRLTHCYTLMSQNPQGCFTDGKGKSLPPSEAMEKLDRMAQSLGEKIDQENELLKGQIKGLAKKKE